MSKSFDAYIVGLGGQGVLTIGELLAEAGLQKGLPVKFYPTKGMSQRGGFVQGQLRFGRENIGPSLPGMSADLVVSMERSESLKGVKYATRGGEFLIYDDAWLTTAVVTKKAAYPELGDVLKEIKEACATLYYISGDKIPKMDGVPVRVNMYILGALLSNTALKSLFTLEEIIAVTKEAFHKDAGSNIAALEAGYASVLEPV